MVQIFTRKTLTVGSSAKQAHPFFESAFFRGLTPETIMFSTPVKMPGRGLFYY